MPEPPFNEHPIIQILGLPDRERVAIHEAGHAIVAYYSGARVMSARLADDPLEEELGYTRVLVQPGRTDIAASVALGGEAAESIRYKRRVEPLTSVDYQRARSTLGAECDGNRGMTSHLTEFTFFVVQQLLRDVWPEVESLAKALSEAGYLSGAEIERIIRGGDRSRRGRRREAEPVVADEPDDRWWLATE